MHRSSSETVAVERARWLGELAMAIDQAQQLAWQVGVSEGRNDEAMDLYARLELARIEVEHFRRSGWATTREEIAPEWLDLLPAGGSGPSNRSG